MAEGDDLTLKKGGLVMLKEEINPGIKIPLLEEVEARLNELIKQKKEAIERELEEKIRREKEEAERRIKEIEEEFFKEKQLLEDYQRILNDFESERMRLQQEIKERFERVIDHQKEIERLASLTLEEIKEVNELSQKLEALEQRSGEKIAFIRKQIEEKYGLVTEMPEIPVEANFKLYLEKELDRLKKIKDLLSEKNTQEKIEEGEKLETFIETTPEPIQLVEKEPIGEEAAKREERIPLTEFEITPPKIQPEEIPSMDIPPTEISPVEPKLTEEATLSEIPSEEIIETFQEVYEKLEGYRRVHSEGNGDVSYFERGERKIIDAEALIAAMNEALEASKRLYQKLSQTDSPKDHFFIKQEIINQQEILRKHLLHIIKLCEKEGYTLPAFTQSVVDSNLLRDLLERLSIENWSDETDFQAITELIESLKEDFYRLITPPVSYLKALLTELGVS